MIKKISRKVAKTQRKMKNSGIEWLGKIPEEWEVVRLKYSATLINQKVDASSNELPYIGLENIESWTGKQINNNGESTSEGQSNIFKSGDVLFGKLRPYLAKVFSTKDEGICTGELLVLRPQKVINNFLFYYLLARDFIMIVNSSTYGAKMPRANWDFVGNLPSLIPPIEEQKYIASFLHRETEKIDALIAKKERQTELLQEKRSALISHAVTGKIMLNDECGMRNKNTKIQRKMKDSGIEWLGKIPAHWEVWKVSHGFQIIGSGTTPKSDDIEYYGGNIFWVTTSELRELIIEGTNTKLTKKALD